MQTTPLFGQLTFTNLIARLNPSADRYLTLACHYDSKHMREGEFLAATDSAVPCAMMLDLAHALSHRLEPFKKSVSETKFVSTKRTQNKKSVVICTFALIHVIYRE